MKYTYTIHIDVEGKSIRVFASSNAYEVKDGKEVAGPTDCKEMTTTYPSMLGNFIISFVGELLMKHFPVENK